MTDPRYAFFEKVVLANVVNLCGNGYRFDPDNEIPDHLWLIKNPVPGVLCTVEFQLKQHYSPPVQLFNVRLKRKRLPDYKQNTERYTPLVVTLRNFMHFGYHIDIFPDDKFWWEFEDEIELSEEVRHAEYYVVNYGLEWLEDPLSTAYWRDENPQ